MDLRNLQYIRSLWLLNLLLEVITIGKDLNGRELGKGLSQRKDGRYEGRFSLNNKKYSVYSHKLGEVKVLLKKKREEVENEARKGLVKDDEMTLMTWFEKWFNEYKLNSLKKSGVPSYRRKFVNTVGRLLGNVKLDNITNMMVQKATKDLANEGYSPRTIREGISVMQSCLDIAVANRMIDRNPCIGIQIPNFETVKEERRVLTLTEQDIIMKEVENTYYYEFYAILLSTGIRIGEAGGLQWQDIDFENKFINIKRSLYCNYDGGKKDIGLTTPKTTNSYRKIPFFGETEKLLKSQKKKQKEIRDRLGKRWRSPEEFGDLVFTTSTGSPVTRYNINPNLNRLVDSWNKKELFLSISEGREPLLMKRFSVHSFRHTMCSRLFEKNVNINIIQKILGHANINTTLGYAHALEDELQKQAGKIGNFFDKSPSDE